MKKLLIFTLIILSIILCKGVSITKALANDDDSGSDDGDDGGDTEVCQLI